jgi:hypothetical protein
MLWRNSMEYVQANILRLPCTSIHTPREKMIERAQLYQDTLAELFVKEFPSGGTMHPDHGRDLHENSSRRSWPGCERSQHRPNYFLPYPEGSADGASQIVSSLPRSDIHQRPSAERGREPAPCLACPSRFAQTCGA